jgi:hypothetical protein
MEINVIENFFLSQENPQKECLLALRQIVMSWDENITENWKYGLPFYYYNGKPFCYFWKDKKTNEHYIGLVRATNLVHPFLIKGTRKKMKILPVNPTEDIPLDVIHQLFDELRKAY